ncbi:MAG: DUF2281 domain-containing protein [Spirulina sp. SIO3F2]|nr:DUF2281 domain-containing protein [Spirulina sp. SIO3F2]
MLNSSATQRQRLIEAIQTLPDDVLVELTGYISYLQYRHCQPYEIRQYPISDKLATHYDSK